MNPTKKDIGSSFTKSSNKLLLFKILALEYTCTYTKAVG